MFRTSQFWVFGEYRVEPYRDLLNIDGPVEASKQRRLPENRIGAAMTRIAAGNVKLKRAYEAATAADGRRILVDRLWPRGVKKADAAIDLWLKDLAPSTDLRKWFGHEPARWEEFSRRYRAEIDRRSDQLAELRKLAQSHPITLVYSAHDELHNNAVALRDIILGR